MSRRFSLLLLLLLLIVLPCFCPSGRGIAVASLFDDPRAGEWQRLLGNDVSLYPSIAPAAEAQVAGQPLLVQLAFVTGAIGGHGYPAACAFARADPKAFMRVARPQFFRNSADYAYVHSQGLTARIILGAYLNGVLFACTTRFSN
jgi:hypothetical protein